MLTAVIVAIVWLLGATISAMVFVAIGKRSNPKYDSWTGDYTLDTWTIILWPVSWVVLAGIVIGRGLARLLVA